MPRIMFSLVIALFCTASHGKTLREACPTLARQHCSRAGIKVKKTSDLGPCLKSYAKKAPRCAKFTWAKGSRMNVAGTIIGCKTEVAGVCPKAVKIAEKTKDTPADTMKQALHVVDELSPVVKCLNENLESFSEQCRKKFQKRILYIVGTGILD